MFDGKSVTDMGILGPCQKANKKTQPACHVSHH